MMFFSRVGIRPDHRALLGLYTTDSYAEHKLLWSLFPDQKADEGRPFLYRRESERDGAGFYVVSHRTPATDHPVLSVETKQYQPKLHAGERLEFKLRANPIISRRDEHGKLHRHDVVMDAKRVGAADGTGLASLTRQAGLEWLAKRAAKHGFEIEEERVRVDGYRQQRWFKRGQPEPVRLSTLDFSGVLRIDDPDAVTAALGRGIGPAKGFGCGLLLVRRV